LRYGQVDSVLHGSGILAPDILGRELNVEHGGADVRVSHQLLESGGAAMRLHTKEELCLPRA